MESTERRKVYLQQLYDSVPRILSELDRDPFSRTYGSFDREYWAWATKDFSNIDLQRATYPLALLYSNDLEGNPWYKKPRLKDWIIASIRFWCRSQHKDGSFDHHYPNENSFVCTAFTLYELSRVYSEFKDKGGIDADLENFWLPAMVKAADFLCKNDERHGFISNHRAGASCALFSMFLITQESRYKERAYFFIDSIKKMMSQKEGWLYEYGGTDPGYQTLDTYYLANFYRLTKDKKILDELIVPSLKFLIYFFHPDGSVGGEYGSRNCPLYYPAGFEILGDVMPEAKAIAQIGALAISKKNSPALSDHDIRNFVPMLASYAQAVVAIRDNYSGPDIKMPFTQEFSKYWPEAGLFVNSDSKFYTVIGLSKGGVIKVFAKDKGGLVAAHAGYLIGFNNGKFCSNQFLERGADILNTEKKITLVSYFFDVVHLRTMTPLRFLLFRIFNLTIGKCKPVNQWVRYNLITKIFIHRKIRYPVSVKRTFEFKKESILIIDEFSGLEQRKVESLRSSDIFTTIYMGSAKYFRNSESIADDLSKTNLLEIFLRGSKHKIAYKIDSNGLHIGE